MVHKGSLSWEKVKNMEIVNVIVNVPQAPALKFLYFLESSTPRVVHFWGMSMLLNLDPGVLDPAPKVASPRSKLLKWKCGKCECPPQYSLPL